MVNYHKVRFLTRNFASDVPLISTLELLRGFISSEWDIDSVQNVCHHSAPSNLHTATLSTADVCIRSDRDCLGNRLTVGLRFHLHSSPIKLESRDTQALR